MEKQGKIITVGNLKGGVGKSSVTALIANHLFLNNKDVVVIDCDNKQASLLDLREVDLAMGFNDEEMYPLSALKSSEAHTIIPEIYKPAYDYIFIDLPGNIEQEGVMECYLISDVIIVPFNITKVDISASVKFYNYLLKNNYKGKIIGVPNKIMAIYSEWRVFLEKEGEKRDERFNDVTRKYELPFEVTENWIKYDQIVFDRRVSTGDELTNALNETVGNKLIEELIKFITDGK